MSAFAYLNQSQSNHSASARAYIKIIEKRDHFIQRLKS